MLSQSKEKSIKQRLSKIKQELAQIPPSNEKSVLLYQQAVGLFRLLGNTKAALGCIQEIDKFNQTKDNRKQIKKKALIETIASNQWSSLALEIWVLIISYGLSVKDIYRLSTASLDFSRLLRTAPLFWKYLDFVIPSPHLENRNIIETFGFSRGLAKSLVLSGARRITSSLFTLLGRGKFPPRALETLTVSHTSCISGASICLFLGHRNLSLTLKCLNVSFMTKMDNENLAAILKKMKGLQVLNISGCALLTDSCLENVQTMPCLETLVMRSSKMTDKFIQKLAAISRNTLKSLDLNDSKLITKRAIEVLTTCVKLERVDFTGINARFPESVHLTSTLVLFSQTCGNLKGFQWRACPFITDAVLCSITEFCPLLDMLVLDSSANVRQEGFKSLYTVKPKLQALSLKCCPGMPPNLFTNIIMALSRTLLKLDIGGNPWVIDSHISLLSCTCQNLSILGICKVSNVTSIGAHQLTRKVGVKFKQVLVGDNNQFSNDCIQALRTAFGYTSIIVN